MSALDSLRDDARCHRTTAHAKPTSLGNAFRDSARGRPLARRHASPGIRAERFRPLVQLTAAEGREGLALVGRDLGSDVIDGKTYWFGLMPRAPVSKKPAVDFVQGYDEIIMSYSESRDESFRLGDAPFFNAVLLDGRLIGHWKPTAQRNSVLIATVLNRALAREEKKAVATAVGLTAAWMSGK